MPIQGTPSPALISHSPCLGSSPFGLAIHADPSAANALTLVERWTEWNSECEPRTSKPAALTLRVVRAMSRPP